MLDAFCPSLLPVDAQAKTEAVMQPIPKCDKTFTGHAASEGHQVSRVHVNGDYSGLNAWRDCVLEDAVEAVEEWSIFSARGDVSIEGVSNKKSAASA